MPVICWQRPVQYSPKALAVCARVCSMDSIATAGHSQAGNRCTIEVPNYVQILHTSFTFAFIATPLLCTRCLPCQLNMVARGQSYSYSMWHCSSVSSAKIAAGSMLLFPDTGTRLPPT